MTDSTVAPLPFLLLVLLAPQPAAQDANARARQLFVANCASCHGESGDGKGTAELDRPARSFQDGGFSFGNTPEALFRTISVGIPGTPMAGFEASLSEEERKRLADYVVTLGPPIEAVAEEDMILAVHERPLVVRGLLPPLAEGLPSHPRGLLIGDPSGITFEYRVDDVRLLALRQGGFVKRTDWTGRGGTALEPLGKVVHLFAGGKPGPLFSLGAGAFPLEARLSGTRVALDAELEYHLVSPAGEVAHVVERPSLVKAEYGTGVARDFVIRTNRARVHLAFADASQGPGEALLEDAALTQDAHGGDGRLWRCVHKGVDGAVTLHVVTVFAERSSRKDGVVIVDLDASKPTHVRLETIPLGEWNESVRSKLEDAR